MTPQDTLLRTPNYYDSEPRTIDPGCAPQRACRQRIPRTVRYHAPIRSPKSVPGTVFPPGRMPRHILGARAGSSYCGGTSNPLARQQRLLNPGHDFGKGCFKLAEGLEPGQGF